MRILILIAFSFGLVFPSFAWQQQGGDPSELDSMMTSLKDSLLVKSDLDSIASRRKSQDMLTLEELINKGKSYTLLSNEIRLELENSLDTSYLSSEIASIDAVLVQLEKRAGNPEAKFNFRYVNALDRILEKTQEGNLELDLQVQNKLDNLNRLDSILNEIRNDHLFNIKIHDTLLLPNYVIQLERLKRNIHTLDSTLLGQVITAARFQSQLSMNTIRLGDLKLYVEKSKSLLEKSLFTKEINFIWEDYLIPSPKSILKITTESLGINLLLLRRQLSTQTVSLILSFVLIIGLYLILRLVMRQIKEDLENSELVLGKMRFLPKSPFAGLMVSLIPVLYFLFEQGSINFIALVIFFQVAFSSWLIFKSFDKLIVFKWLGLVVIFIFFTLSNLYWEIAYQERMYFLLGDVIALLILARIGSGKFASDDKNEEKFVNRIRKFSGAMLLLGIVANLLGRFSLAKILSVAGMVSFVHSVTLYFFVKVTMEVIYLLAENNKKHDALDALLNFQEIQKRMKSLLVGLALVFWFMILLHNLALNSYFNEALGVFLTKERMLGNTPFTFESILLFGGLVYGSSILANNIAYFFSINDQKKGDVRGKKLGSSVLIIRLGILIVGFFIAATAAKIPLDKITIVLGALSVGIGFGLQTIINNLVSGLILAFERPIQIGDDIEVGTMTGKVKEVGIRASKILAYDGSEIIVPNGDLLSQSLINWTLSDKRRRVELILGVAYQSDMKLVKSLIEEVLNKARILHFPLPKILMQKFGDNSVDFRVLFWVESMDIYLDVRDEVMNAIFEAFHSNGIEIPFPKRDMYIKSLPQELIKPSENKKSPEI